MTNAFYKYSQKPSVLRHAILNYLYQGLHESKCYTNQFSWVFFYREDHKCAEVTQSDINATYC